MDAAYPFYCQYPAAGKELLRAAACIIAGQGRGTFYQTDAGEPACKTGLVMLGARRGLYIKNFRTAFRAAVRLSVIPPVIDVIIFVPAVVTHGELFHYGTLPVIGQRFDDRISGAAVCTVDKRITISPVRGSAQFGLAFGAHGDIRGNEGCACFHAAFPYCKLFKSIGWPLKLFRSDRFDLRQRRWRVL